MLGNCLLLTTCIRFWDNNNSTTSTTSPATKHLHQAPSSITPSLLMTPHEVGSTTLPILQLGEIKAQGGPHSSCAGKPPLIRSAGLWSSHKRCNTEGCLADWSPPSVLRLAHWILASTQGGAQAMLPLRSYGKETAGGRTAVRGRTQPGGWQVLSLSSGPSISADSTYPGDSLSQGTQWRW